MKFLKGTGNKYCRVLKDYSRPLNKYSSQRNSDILITEIIFVKWLKVLAWESNLSSNPSPADYHGTLSKLFNLNLNFLYAKLD